MAPLAATLPRGALKFDTSAKTADRDGGRSKNWVECIGAVRLGNVVKVAVAIAFCCSSVVFPPC